MTSLATLRRAAGLTQTELAARAGVSRQLVGAVEAGRHLPRVDAALALASVLGVDVATLFAADAAPVDVVSGSLPDDGAMVRTGRVGDRVVTAPVRIGLDGWDVADAVMEDGVLSELGRLAPGLVVAGCEPGLEVLERMLREGGMSAVAATASSAVAAAALAAGRVHAAVVHGPLGHTIPLPEGVSAERFRIARWHVGLAGPADAIGEWWLGPLSGRTPVVQREAGAGVQRTFEDAVGPGGAQVPGPRVASHLVAAQRASLTGMAAVTIEPAALAVGVPFHPLDVHEAQLWVDRRWLRERAIAEALDVVSSRRFQRRLAGVGGYDLSECGVRVA